MQWSELDLDRKLWIIPGERTKNKHEHIVPLIPQMIALLPEPRREYVFGHYGIGFNNWDVAKGRLNSVADWTLHDLRRTAATGMAELGILPHIIESLLNHVSGHKAGVAGIYNKARYLDEMRAALERWAAHVATLAG